MDSGLKFCSNTLDTTQLKALELWTQQLFQPINPSSSRERRRKLKDAGLSQLRTKVFILSCLGHIRLVNKLVDGQFLRALTLSYFENHYNGSQEPRKLFNFINQRFMVLNDIDNEVIRFGRGRLIFRFMRCLHIHKATPEILAMLFVSACRMYNISARLVISIQAVTNRISFSAEAFETTNGSWKSVDFSTMTYDGTKYDMLRTPKPSMPEAQVTCNERDECQHNGYLFVKRQNKLFIYKQQDELAIVTIVILRSQCAERVILNPVLFPFEAAELKVRLMQQTERKKHKGNIKDYIYVLGCNSKGWISELTPKHVERYNDACLNRGKNINTWLIRTIELINHKLKGLPEIGLVSLLERAEQKWMQTRVNNDPFPQTKAKFKNHPTYILASQIGNNRVRKKDATPLGYVKGEEVYLLSDFEDIKSRSAWLKVNRRVLDDATPVTTRKMYHKSHRMYMNTNLYQFSQTEPIPQVSMVDGTIPTNEYDNVDVTGEKFVPEGTIYIRSKKSGLIFKTARSLNLYHKKAFSEYQEVDTLKPEIDGIVIRTSDLSIFLRTYEEFLLNETKLEQEQKKESYRKLWRSAFKTMLSDPPSVAVQQHRKIRKVLGDSVTKFLNRLEHVT